MSVDAIEIKRFLSDELNLQESDLGLETSLFSSGLLDSFSMIELVTFLEKSAGIRIRPTELTLENFDSIVRIQEFLARR